MKLFIYSPPNLLHVTKRNMTQQRSSL